MSGARGRRAARFGARAADAPPPQFQTARLQIGDSQGDAHELSSGAVSTTATTLPIGRVSNVSDPTYVAFRFSGVPIAQGQSVAFSRLRLVAKSASASNAPTLRVRVRAESADDAAPLTTTAYGISDRIYALTEVVWTIPGWSVNEDSTSTVSPDISSVIQEVVNRAGWVSGNALVLVLTLYDDTDSPTFREAHSYDSDSARAPRLSINDTDSISDPPAPAGDTGTFSDGYDRFGLEGNANFNLISPTLKDGTAFTNNMSLYYSAFLTAFLRNTNVEEYCSPVGQYTFRNNDVYQSGRGGALAMGLALQLFRLTGDLRILDRGCEGWNLTIPNLKTTWDADKVIPNTAIPSMCGATTNGSTWTVTSNNPPWSPYENWNYRGGDGNTTQIGADITRVQVIKPWAHLAEFTWALHLNRNKTSPGGFNYGTLADYWMGKLLDNLKAWSETSSACWTTNYKGIDGDNNGFGNSYRRAAWGTWPVLFRAEQHVMWDSVFWHRYMGFLGASGQGGSYDEVPNAADAHAVGDLIIPRYKQYSTVQDLDAYGNVRYLSRSVDVLRPPPWSTLQARASYSTYTSAISKGQLRAYLTNAWPTYWNDTEMTRWARSYAEMHNADGSVKLNIASSQDRTGHGLAMSGYVRDATNNMRSAYGTLMAWEEHALIWNASTAAQNSVGGGYGAGARGHNIPAAQFLRLALLASGSIA